MSSQSATDVPKKSLIDLFSIKVAKSKGVNDYSPGNIPLVTSAEVNNGVVPYVEPEEDDTLFEGPSIVISGLGYATVHLNKFLPKGNGGDSLTILKPREPMTVERLIFFAAAFNVLHKWRFSYGRKCSVSRIVKLNLPLSSSEVDNVWNVESSRLSSIIGLVGSALKNVVEPSSSGISSTVETNPDK
jgi:hypothetical protein